MLSSRKALKAVKGQLEAAEALEDFSAAQADLESAIIACDTGILQPTKDKDTALNELAQAIQVESHLLSNSHLKELGAHAKIVATTAKNAPEDLGPAMKQVAAAASRAVTAATAVAATLDDKNQQKAILNALKATTDHVKSLLQVSKAVAGTDFLFPSLWCSFT